MLADRCYLTFAYIISRKIPRYPITPHSTDEGKGQSWDNRAKVTLISVRARISVTLKINVDANRWGNLDKMHSLIP